MTTKKTIEKELDKINKRRQDIIRELDNIDKRKAYLTELSKSPKLRQITHIEIQKEIHQVTLGGIN